jgi:hypothetical protein
MPKKIAFSAKRGKNMRKNAAEHKISIKERRNSCIN